MSLVRQPARAKINSAWRKSASSRASVTSHIKGQHSRSADTVPMASWFLSACPTRMRAPREQGLCPVSCASDLSPGCALQTRAQRLALRGEIGWHRAGASEPTGNSETLQHLQEGYISSRASLQANLNTENHHNNKERRKASCQCCLQLLTARTGSLPGKAEGRPPALNAHRTSRGSSWSEPQSLPSLIHFECFHVSVRPHPSMVPSRETAEKRETHGR